MTGFIRTFVRDESGEVVLSYGLIIALVTVTAFIGLEAYSMSFEKLVQAVRNAMATAAAA